MDAAGRPLYRENEGCRHAFATHAVAEGLELDRVRKVLGHTTTKTTERYARLATSGLVGVIRR